jgi:hypothetical protein
VKNKVKEVIKEENEEKDSLFNEIKIKSQAAMEYLMTYGWAILIIALSLVVLYSLGIMNPKNFIPRAPPGSCFVFRPNGPGTTDYISLQGTCGYLPMYVASFSASGGGISLQVNSYLEPQQLTLSTWFFEADRSKVPSYPQVADVDYNWIKGYTLLLSQKGDANAGLIIGNGSECWCASAPKIGNWVHVVGTYNGSLMKVYFNGQLVASRNCKGPIDYSGVSGRVAMGTNVSIANVQIYNTALTQQEIQYLYQQGLGGGPVRLQNLVAWWPLNGDAKDYSGNNNHGTIYGGVTSVQNYNPP